MLLVVVAEFTFGRIFLRINPIAPSVLFWEAAVFLSAILAIWFRPLLRARAFSLALLTLWFGFVAFGFLVRSEQSYAIGLGSVCLLGVVLLIRKLVASRVTHP
jgi:hypothetical protein